MKRRTSKLGHADVTYGKSAAEAIAGHVGRKEPKRPKFNNQPIIADGIRFDSKAEHVRYCSLKLLLQLGRIAELRIHPKYDLHGWTPEGKNRVTSYRPDFTYIDECGQFVVEDVKGGRATRTEAYVIRKKLFEGEYGLKIVEVTK